MGLPLSALVLSSGFALASPACFTPCNWDHRPANCTFVELKVDPQSDSTQMRTVLTANATYRVEATHGTKEMRIHIWQRLSEGETRETFEAALRAYFARNATLTGTWGRITSGTCAPDEFRVPIPGCRDQRSQTCYDLAMQ